MPISSISKANDQEASTSQASLDQGSGIVRFLKEKEIVSHDQLQRALDYQQELGGRIEKILINLGVIQKDELTSLYADYLSLPLFTSDIELSLTPEFILSLDVSKGVEEGILPFAQGGRDGLLSVAVLDPLNIQIYELWIDSEFDLDVHLATQSQFDELRIKLLAERSSEQKLTSVKGGNELERLRELAFGAPTVNLVNSLIVKGIKLRASDMHIEPYKGQYRVRYRVDGILHLSENIPIDLQLGVISRIKILSGMDIAERRKPQDGKIETSVAGKELDIRVSSLPLGEGESMVMRFLLKESVSFGLDTIGYELDLISRIEKDLARTTGVILMTGPTGSGKTTSLYSFLAKLNQPAVKIITLEDPIEYQLDGINQVQVNTEIGYDFAKGLRSIVRQDPDIIMIGEIRDHETARIAMQSSLTGHLVFSTVHTNDAPTTFTRLLDLGVEEFLLNASVISIMAQRLVRTLCPNCKVPDPNVQHLLELPEVNHIAKQYGVSHPHICIQKGCESCGGSGFKGRMAILEYLPNNIEVQSMPKDHTFIEKVREFRIENNLRTLKEDGLLKVLNGVTTYEEVMRVAG
ncbi:Flp pilus assembly complex ATPase component TadA [Shewanella mesophila]|uniref:GspE/PulE family protein n=1 Tax=Shewanella mesophila TaxID=2864208 RepID=UPI001C658052|nr:GspE/PulE family protein [Shewanella mesophila]QYJ85007.1 Flp pilus assembly complex ATPase component TadA [Shewanella mesophila]